MKVLTSIATYEGAIFSAPGANISKLGRGRAGKAIDGNTRRSARKRVKERNYDRSKRCQTRVKKSERQRELNMDAIKCSIILNIS